MAEAFTLRLLAPGDLPDYKQLRDEMLALHADAFISDASEERLKSADSYASRLGTADGSRGSFTLGAWAVQRLVGAITLQREARRKAAHVGLVSGMMVRPEVQSQGVGRALLTACIAACREATGLERLTLSVTSSNAAAAALYRQAGFTRYGTLEQAIKLDNRYFDKDLMMLAL